MTDSTATLMVLVVFAGIISWIGLRSAAWFFKALSGFSWIVPFVYVINNPPATLAKGSTEQTTLLVVLGAIAAGCWVYAFGRESETTENDGKRSVLKRVFQLRNNAKPNHRETAEEYRERMQAARARGRGSVSRR